MEEKRRPGCCPGSAIEPPFGYAPFVPQGEQGKRAALRLAQGKPHNKDARSAFLQLDRAVGRFDV